MIEQPTAVGRYLRRLFPGRNPLVRGCDRVESAALVLALLAVLIALPVAASAGSQTYARQLDRMARQQAERHQAVAVLLADAPRARMNSEGSAVRQEAEVPARWELPDGTGRAGVLTVPRGASAGTEVPVWLDRDGNVVRPPIDESDAVSAAVWLAIAVWLAVGTLLGLVCQAVHDVCERVRSARWDRELRQAISGRADT